MWRFYQYDNLCNIYIKLQSFRLDGNPMQTTENDFTAQEVKSD